MAVKESLILEIQAELGTVKSKIEGLVNEFKELKTQLVKTEIEAEKTANELKGIKGAISGLESIAKRLPSTFDQWTQRITFFYFNLLAIKDLIDQIAGPLKTGFSFNATLENTKLGFAAILTSLGEIKENGQEITDQAEKFNKALLLAEDLQRRLRIEAVKSVATYKELTEIAQGILAPYLAAGGKLEELPQFAVLMANLVKTFQLPIEQAVQEARDILSGTITSDTQTARALGITNEDIKRWKEQGVLIEKLKERLNGIVIASERLQDTWSGILSNLQDAFELFASVASKPLFEAVKKDLKQILDYVLVIDKTTGEVRLNPELLEKAKKLGNTLKEVYNDLKEFAQGVYNFGKNYGSVLIELAKAYLAFKIGAKAFSFIKGTIEDVKLLKRELALLKAEAEKFAEDFYKAVGNNPKALALFKAGFLAEWALISYQAGQLFWEALDKATGGFISWLSQKFFLLIDRIGVELRKLLGELHLPGGLRDEEYEKELQRLNSIEQSIEEEYRKGVSIFDEQSKAAQKVLETRQKQKEVEENLKQTQEGILNLEYQINQAQQIDKDNLEEIEKAVKETAKGYEQWLRQLERLKELANTVLERIKQSYERVKNFLFPQKEVSIPEQIRNLFEQFKNAKAKLSVETDPSRIKALLGELDRVRAKAEQLMTSDKFKNYWEQFRNWLSTHGGLGYTDLLTEKFGLPKDLAEKVLTQGFKTYQELFKATFGELFNVSDLAPNLQQNLDKQIAHIQNALTQLVTLQNQLVQLEKGVNIPIKFVDIENQVQSLISAIPKEITVKVRLQPVGNLTPDGQYREGV